MKDSLQSVGLADHLQIGPVRFQQLQSAVMYLVFQGYVKKAPGDPFDFSALSAGLLHHFKGEELVLAAYVFGAIEQETINGENFFLLEDLRQYAARMFSTTELNKDQFDDVCEEISNHYQKIGRIQAS